MTAEPRRIVMLTQSEVKELLTLLETVFDEDESTLRTSAREKLEAVADREHTDRDLPRAIETLRRDVG